MLALKQECFVYQNQKFNIKIELQESTPFKIQIPYKISLSLKKERFRKDIKIYISTKTKTINSNHIVQLGL